jgi:HAD superfamily hydrolase (TIGR01509 family)
MSPPRPTAVLFDFGMTLLGRRPGPTLVADGAVALGAAPPDPTEVAGLWDAVQALARSPEEMAKGRDLSPDAHRDCWVELYRPFDAYADGLAEWLYAREASAAGWLPYPDTAPTLEALRRNGIGIGVVSDTGFDLRPLFAAWGLDALIDTWTMSYEVGVTKPHPAMFRAACTALGVAPGDALMVGDNHRADGGAAEVGMPVVILPLVEPGDIRGLEVVLRWCGVA